MHLVFPSAAGGGLLIKSEGGGGRLLQSLGGGCQQPWVVELTAVLGLRHREAVVGACAVRLRGQAPSSAHSEESRSMVKLCWCVSAVHVRLCV